MKLRHGLRPLDPDPDCQHVARVLQAYLDGELGPDDAEKVAAHLAVCEYCGIQRDTIDAVRAAIRRQRPDLDVERITRLERFVRDLADEAPDSHEGG